MVIRYRGMIQIPRVNSGQAQDAAEERRPASPGRRDTNLCAAAAWVRRRPPLDVLPPPNPASREFGFRPREVRSRLDELRNTLATNSKHSGDLCGASEMVTHRTKASCSPLRLSRPGPPVAWGHSTGNDASTRGACIGKPVSRAISLILARRSSSAGSGFRARFGPPALARIDFTTLPANTVNIDVTSRLCPVVMISAVGVDLHVEAVDELSR